MNTPSQQALWQALFPESPVPQYAHMSVTVSDSGGKLSKRERPETLRRAIGEKAKNEPELLSIIADNSSLSVEDLQEFLDGKKVPDIPDVEKVAQFLGVPLPEINIIDFFRSGYLPETLVNFLALLGWNPGDQREIMTTEELICAFDPSRLTKSNSLFDRKKLLAFNMEHLRIEPREKVLAHLKAYLKEMNSPLLAADDATLLRIMQLCDGARTFDDIERKSVFVFVDDDRIEFDEKAVGKVLLKDHALDILQRVREELARMDQFTEQAIEGMLRGLAEEKQVGLGKVAQPLRVALCGTTISLPIFDSVSMLGKERTLRRIDLTLQRFAGKAT